jgi:hypothetical protein
LFPLRYRCWTGWYDRPSINVEGGRVFTPAWEAHNGRIPLYFDFDAIAADPLYGPWMKVFFERIGTYQSDKIGLDLWGGGKAKWPASRLRTYSIHGGAGGIWATDKNCAASIPGLFAAGNSCGTMASAGTYAGGGFGSNHAMVTGTRAD